MTPRRYAQVDVFTAVPYLGNPLAVVIDGQGLSEAQMQHFAHWTNLSETTFLLPPTQPEADYRVRIFTPGAELPFAGHPTLGSCHAWLASGGQARAADEIVQECGIGLVRLRRHGEHWGFAAPKLQRQEPPTGLLEPLLQALGLGPQQLRAAQLLDNGPVWLGLLLDSPATVLALAPDPSVLRRLGHKVGVAAIGAPDELVVRAFAAPIGVPEDPVTGSLNASLAQWLIADGYMPTKYTAQQGHRLGREGRVLLSQDSRDTPGQVWVAGASVTCIEGQVLL